MTNLIYINEENFKVKVTNSKIPVIIDFYADWCTPCRMMAPIFEELSEEYKDILKFTKLNTEENPRLAEKFSIRSIPSLVVIKEGKEIARIMGFMDKDTLKEKINSILDSI